MSQTLPRSSVILFLAAPAVALADPGATVGPLVAWALVVAALVLTWRADRVAGAAGAIVLGVLLLVFFAAVGLSIGGIGPTGGSDATFAAAGAAVAPATLVLPAGVAATLASRARAARVTAAVGSLLSTAWLGLFVLTVLFWPSTTGPSEALFVVFLFGALLVVLSMVARDWRRPA